MAFPAHIGHLRHNWDILSAQAQVAELSVDGSELEIEKTQLSVEIKQLLAQPDNADDYGPISLH